MELFELSTTKMLPLKHMRAPSQVNWESLPQITRPYKYNGGSFVYAGKETSKKKISGGKYYYNSFGIHLFIFAAATISKSYAV